MGRNSKVRRFARFLWGGWEFWGVIATIGVGTVSECVLFLFAPFLKDIPLWLKAVYAFGLFLIVIVITAAMIRILQALFKPQNEGGFSQNISQTKAGRDIFQAGGDISVNQPDNIPLEFSVKMDKMSLKRGVYLSKQGDTKESIPRLEIYISFKTNQPIQIASIHIEIDPVDPRDIIEPDPDLAQGFTLPHTIPRSETQRFQFPLHPDKASGKQILLKVLAGGGWYSDGPYKFN